MTTPDHWNLPREDSGTPPAATDLVMLVPPTAGDAPKMRNLQEVGDTFAGEEVNPRAGVVSLLYWDPSETEFRFNTSGEYRFSILNLHGETIQVGERIALWIETNDSGSVFDLVDSADLANAGGLSGPHRITDNFAIVRATTAKSTPGFYLKMSGDHGTVSEPEQLRYIVHGAWRISSDADDIGVEALKAAVQSAIDAEAFPPPYSASRVWSPGEYFYLENAVYRTVQHIIGVAASAVPTAAQFEKVLDGAAVNPEDIDSRVADWAEQGNTDQIPDLKRSQPIPLSRIPNIPSTRVIGLPDIPALGIAGRTNSTVDLSHGSQTVTLPAALNTEAGLIRGQDQAKLSGLVRNRFVGEVSGPTNYLDGDIVWEQVGRRIILARATRDFQTGPSDRRPSNDTAGRWVIVVDFTMPTVPTTIETVHAMEALTGDDRFDYGALRNTPSSLPAHFALNNRGAYAQNTSYLTGDFVFNKNEILISKRNHTSPASSIIYANWERLLAITAYIDHDGRMRVSLDESVVISEGSGGFILDDDGGATARSAAYMYNRHEWAQGETFYPENLVRHNSIRYICLVEHVSTASNAPGTGVGSTTYWEAW